jgi:hypothetical protein
MNWIIGFGCLVSQLCAVQAFTPSRSAASSWVMESMSQRRRMWSPKVFGSKSHAF